jgi:hypothetical protein
MSPSRPRAKVPDGPVSTSKPPRQDRDRGLVCRMAGNIAGPSVASLMEAAGNASAPPEEIEEAVQNVCVAAIDMAEAIVAEYDRRHG